MIFENMQEAAQELVRKLRRYKSKKLQIVAIVPGGVPVAKEIADALGAQLDVVITKPLNISDDGGLGQIGAVAEGEVRVVDEFAMEIAQVPWELIEHAAFESEQEVKNEILKYREGRSLDVKDKNVVVVADGVSSEAVVLAAVEAVRRLGAKKVILASPVCALSIAEDIIGEVDEAVFLATPFDLGEARLWYKKYEDVADKKVQSILRGGKREPSKASKHQKTF